MDVTTARKRARLLDLVRQFFIEEGYLETDVPALSPDRIPEPNIVPFETTWVRGWDSPRTYWLLPSPERHLKHLLAEGYPNLFFLGKVYRNNESFSPHHHPEFTMLEWYQREAHDTDLLATLERLLERIDTEFPLPPTLRPPFEFIDLPRAFQVWAGFDWTQTPVVESMARAARQSGPVGKCSSWEDLWDWLFVDRIEPRLPKDRPVILQGWPARHSGQAACDPERPQTARRWELYAGGLELVNACRETAEPPEGPESYRQACRKLGNISGAALGFDRLLMVLLEKPTIQEVIFFPLMGTLNNHE